MCCSYFMEETTETRPYIDAASRNPLRMKTVCALARPFVTYGEVKPKDSTVAIALNHRGKRSAFPMVWGFTGKESYYLSVQAEKADESPAFIESWERRRCIIPSSWYYDRKYTVSPDGQSVKNGEKYLFQTEGSSLTLLAGIYRIEEENGIKVPHFALLTRKADDSIRHIHDRMPVILDAATAAEWLKPEQSPETLKEIVDRSVTDPVFDKE